MNMTKLASIVGCSPATVSKAFKNSPEISEETKKKIFDVAKKYNCFTKYYSPTFGKHVFAVICNEFSSSVYGSMVESLHKKILENGDFLLISCSKFINSNLDEILDYYINFRNVDGLILIDSLEKYIGDSLNRIPTVSINSLYANNVHKCDFVNIDSSYGFYRAVSHLKEMGHTKIGFIGEYLTLLKLELFKQAMKQCGLVINESWLITSSKRKSEAGFDALDKILAQESRPTAIIAAYDAIAFGAINRIYSAGLKVPDDFSIIGFDNIPLSSFSVPPLSTVSTPADELAEVALDLLYKRLKYKESPFKRVSVQPELIERKSVKNLR